MTHSQGLISSVFIQAPVGLMPLPVIGVSAPVLPVEIPELLELPRQFAYPIITISNMQAAMLKTNTVYLESS
ncbi:hypothetical protein XBO1_2650039 [Xenorhabdus bovienii str. oregonense]|uniref:Uncharacterized protein n=1 Tax=Xenorhabdus bovienii str. oregonense TaxID=1398202 RepID=A0A077NYS1_XENBV|nr:hypothetical protein XBO1_2650039 [Xenorhabdus bovienii str. oregonense]